MDFDNNEFRRCLGSFVTGVTIVTMVDAGNVPQGVTISSFSSLSLEPPMVCFNLGKASYLHGKILNSDAFNVNILAAGQEGLSRKFAERNDNRWDGVGYTKGTHGCPVIDGVSAVIECLTENIYNGGDHSIVTGHVVNLKVFDNKKPLAYYRGGYYSLGGEV